MLLTLGSAMDSSVTRTVSHDAHRFGVACLSPCEVDTDYTTHALPPSHICLQSMANQTRPWPLIIQRVTFVLRTSPVTSHLFMLSDSEPMPTRKRHVAKHLLRFNSQNELPLEFCCSDLQRIMTKGILLDHCDLFQSLLCWGATGLHCIEVNMEHGVVCCLTTSGSCVTAYLT